METLAWLLLGCLRQEHQSSWVATHCMPRFNHELENASLPLRKGGFIWVSLQLTPKIVDALSNPTNQGSPKSAPVTGPEVSHNHSERGQRGLQESWSDCVASIDQKVLYIGRTLGKTKQNMICSTKWEKLPRVTHGHLRPGILISPQLFAVVGFEGIPDGFQ